MPAFIQFPNSAYPERMSVLKGYVSLRHLHEELFNRHKAAHPPREFHPSWHTEPTICNITPNGVELHKWSIAMEKWKLNSVITWKDE